MTKVAKLIVSAWDVQNHPRAVVQHTWARGQCMTRTRMAAKQTAVARVTPRPALLRCCVRALLARRSLTRRTSGVAPPVAIAQQAAQPCPCADARHTWAVRRSMRRMRMVAKRVAVAQRLPPQRQPRRSCLLAAVQKNSAHAGLVRTSAMKRMRRAASLTASVRDVQNHPCVDVQHIWASRKSMTWTRMAVKQAAAAKTIPRLALRRCCVPASQARRLRTRRTIVAAPPGANARAVLNHLCVIAHHIWVSKECLTRTRMDAKQTATAKKIPWLALQRQCVSALQNRRLPIKKIARAASSAANAQAQQVLPALGQK
mmetsp:Transcript_120089/g.218258  ORF Transcript_120089/g.218258 Transcript_120089/m.218258 type:complete len:315 (-) Transcript_120089:136-1080(-)